MAAIVYFLYFVFVQQVVSHWWRQYSLLFWIDTIAMDLFSYLPGLEGGFSKAKTFAGLGGPSWRVSVAFDSVIFLSFHPTYYISLLGVGTTLG